MQEPSKPNLAEAEERGTNIQGGHEQDRLPSLKDVVAPGWPASKAMSHDDLVELVAKAFRLSAEDAYAWIIDGESSTLSRGITTIQPTMPTGPDQGAKKGRGQIQVNSGMFRNAKLDEDGAGPGGAEGSMTGADVHTDVGGRTGKRTKTQGMISLRDNSR